MGAGTVRSRAQYSDAELAANGMGFKERRLPCRRLPGWDTKRAIGGSYDHWGAFTLEASIELHSWLSGVHLHSSARVRID